MEFYRDALGAELLPGAETMILCPWLMLGNLVITLLENTERKSDLDYSQQAMATLMLQVNDLNAAFERAVKHGARVIEPPDEGGVTFLIADPDGIFIEVNHFDSDI